MVTDQVYRIEQ